MIKKVLIGAVACTALATFFFGRDAVSYVRTMGSEVREAVKREVPVEFEIERAREMVEQLLPDIRDCMESIAEQHVDIEELREGIDHKLSDLEQQKADMMTLRTDLDSEDTVFVYASRRYTRTQVARDLADRLQRFQVFEKAVARDQQTLTAWQTALSANQERLDSLLSEKENLAVQIEELEARLRTIQAAESVTTVEFDDSRLARAKRMIRQLNKQLDIREKMLDAEGKITGSIPVNGTEEPATTDVASRFDQYFGLKADTELVQNETE